VAPAASSSTTHPQRTSLERFKSPPRGLIVTGLHTL